MTCLGEWLSLSWSETEAVDRAVIRSQSDCSSAASESLYYLQTPNDPSRP